MDNCVSNEEKTKVNKNIVMFSHQIKNIHCLFKKCSTLFRIYKTYQSHMI